MNQRTIIFLMTANIYLKEEIREALIETAVSMIRSNDEKLSFKIGFAEGLMHKKNDYTPFMGDGGPLFSAEIETELGKGKVKFIVPERYLRALDDGIELGEWLHLDDNSGRAAKAQWN